MYDKGIYKALLWSSKKKLSNKYKKSAKDKYSVPLSIKQKWFLLHRAELENLCKINETKQL